METRTHTHEETFDTSPETLFSLLHTPSAIRQWWGASRAIILAEPGGTWGASWGEDEDQPDYITFATIDVFEAPHQMRLSNYKYFAKTGPLPFEAEFTTTFTVQPTDSGTILRVEQAGFPAASSADDYFSACEKGWADTFAGIRKYLAER